MEAQKVPISGPIARKGIVESDASDPPDRRAKSLSGKRQPLSGEALRRAAAMAIGEGRGPAETARRLKRGTDGGEPIDVTADQVRTATRRLRESGDSDVRPVQLAARMLRLVERELASIEAKRGQVDLDRLDKLAATLRRLEPLKPQTLPSKTGLQALIGDDSSPDVEESDGLAAIKA